MSGVAVLRHGLAARWRAAAVIVASIFPMLLLGLAIYQTMDLGIYDQLPEALRQLMGVPVGASAAVLAYNEMLAVMGALAVGGLAVAVGTDLVAGDERRRTLSYLLSHPVSRLATVSAKALVLLLVTAATAAALWGAAVLSAVLTGVDRGEAHLGELCLALGANALLYGALSFAIGAVTGNKSTAAGIGAGVLVMSWFAAGLLPLWPDYADYARFSPWYWYTEPQILVNGIDAGYLALHLAVAAVLLAVGVAAFPRRDLRTIPPTTLRERLTALPWLARLSRSRRSTSLFGLVFSRSRTLLVVVTATMGLLMGVAMGPVYEQLAPSLDLMMGSIPPEMMALFGADDMSTPAGFYWGETMGMMAPAAVITVVAAAAAGLASEEREGRLGTVLSAPVARARALLATAATLVLYAAIVALATGLGIWAGSELADLGLVVGNIMGSAAHLFALGLLVGGITLLVAAATGSSAAAVWTAVGLGLAGHFGYSMLLLSEDTEVYARLSPFYYYSAAQPLAEDADWAHVALLAGVGLAAMAAAFPLFQRRDLRV